MQKKAKLLWIIFITCFTGTAVILTKNSVEENEIFKEPINFIQYFKSKYKIYKNKSNIEIVTLIGNSFNKVRECMKGRVENVKKVCEKIETKSKVPDSVVLKIVVDKKHGVSWCPIFKAASSTWMKHFAVISGVLTNTTVQLVRENLIQLNNIVKQIFSKNKNYNETLKAIAETKTFLIVRHPFQRLLSAYRDKLERIEGREYYYKRFGRHIVLKYRRNETLSNRTTLIPSFFEFLQFIVNERYFDEHWVPFYESCEPCLINYNYILKFDNLEKEQLYLLRETGLIDYIDSYSEFRNVNPYGATTNTVAKRYFKDIPKWLLEQVYEIYKNDFLLFSYIPDEYYLMTNDNTKL